MKGVAGLNVYKKVAIIRRSTDSVTYEDTDGNLRTVTDLGEVASSSTPLTRPRPKDDIPVPKINNVKSYNSDLTPTYTPPKSYVRYRRPTQAELKENIEYVIDGEDETWLANNSKFGGASAPPNKTISSNSASLSLSPALESAQQKKAGKTSKQGEEKPTFQLQLRMLETMMDVMEKATAFDAIITMDQAELLILKKLPQLHHLYPFKGRAGVVTLKHVITDVYNYWVSKRSKLKRPLLRRFWPVTSSDDTNPHLVFRPREKEKYKLRKKRQNDMDAYRKLKQLKQDFHHVRILLDLVRRREELNRSLLQLQNEWFQQKLYDAVDTSGLPRISKEFGRDELDELLNVTTYFDVPNSWKKSKKSRRGSYDKSSRSNTPVRDLPGSSSSPTGSATGSGAAGASDAGTTTGAGGGGTKSTSGIMPLIVAGQHHGEPAPLFVHPLQSRESYVSSWDHAVPHVTTYIDSHPVPTFRFRHRPRVGRGGRLCIDRMPQPTTPDNITPMTVFTAGNGLPRALQPKERLLDLLPRPLDHAAISRRIESICMDALKEDYDMAGRTTGDVAVASAASGSVGGGVADAEENDGEEAIVKVDDWLNTDDQLWGEERFTLGPI